MPTNDSFSDWDQIAEYLFGDMPSSTHAQFERRLESDPALRELVAAVGRDLAHVTQRDDSARRLRAEQRLIASMHEGSVPGHPVRTQVLPARHARTLGITSVLIVLGIVAASLFHHVSPRQRFAVERIYGTTNAQQADIALPDGSHARLAPESRLVYSETRDGTRLLKLEGEAYFTVEHHADRTFSVQTGSVTTRVLGTTFAVRRYPQDSITQVVVTSGKVSSGGRGTTIVLAAGHVGYVSDSTASSVATDATSPAAAWVTGQLIFRDTPVREVLREASRWCGYDLQLADSSLGAQRVTTMLSVGDPSRTLLALKDLLDVTITVDGNVATLRPHGRGVTPLPKVRPRVVGSPRLEVGK